MIPDNDAVSCQLEKVGYVCHVIWFQVFLLNFMFSCEICFHVFFVVVFFFAIFFVFMWHLIQVFLQHILNLTCLNISSMVKGNVSCLHRICLNILIPGHSALLEIILNDIYKYSSERDS